MGLDVPRQSDNYWKLAAAHVPCRDRAASLAYCRPLVPMSGRTREEDGEEEDSEQHSSGELASFGEAMGKWLDNVSPPAEKSGKRAAGRPGTRGVSTSISSGPEAQHNFALEPRTAPWYGQRAKAIV